MQNKFKVTIAFKSENPAICCTSLKKKVFLLLELINLPLQASNVKLNFSVFFFLFFPVPFLWLTAVCDCINRGENKIF